MHNQPPNPAQDQSPRRDPALAAVVGGWSPAQSWDLIPGLRQPPRYPQKTKGNSSSGWNGVKPETWQMFLLSPAPRGTRC